MRIHAPGRRASRSTAARAASATAVVLTLVALATAGRSGAVFTASAPASAELTAAVLAPPTAVVAERGCERYAPAFVSASLATVPGDPEVSVAMPAAVVPGDLLLAYSITNQSSDLTSTVPVAPAGWTRTTSQLQSYGGSALDVRTVDGTEPGTLTFTGLGDTASAVLVLAYRDVDLGASAFVSQTQNSGGPHSPVGTVGTVASTVIDAWLVTSYSGSFTSPAGTVRASSATGVGVLAADRPVAVLGATGNDAVTLDAISRSHTYLAVLVGSRSDPTVELSWTPSADNRVEGYAGSRSDVPGLWDSVAGWATSAYTDTTLAAGQGATYSLWSYLQGWSSASATVTVPACT